MRQGVLLALVGGAVFVAVGIATLPAILIPSRLPPDVALEGVGGSVWNGSASQFRLRGAPLGALTWTLRPAELLRGRLAFRVNLQRPDGYVRGVVATGLGGGAISARDVELRLPLTALSPQTAATAWRGDLAGSVPNARLETGWPVEASGTFTMSNLQPPGAALRVGNYSLEVDPEATTADQIVGRVHNLDAPLVVRAQLVVRRDRTYLLEGDVTPRPGAPPQVAETVAFLGLPDAQGRRQFTITGSF